MIPKNLNAKSRAAKLSFYQAPAGHSEVEQTYQASHGSRNKLQERTAKMDIIKASGQLAGMFSAIANDFPTSLANRLAMLSWHNILKL